MQSGIVPIKVGVSVVGDVTVAVWFGAYNLGQRLHSRPALAFAFHTAFTDQGSVRITCEQLDLADAGLIPPEAAKGFFINVILTEQPEVAACSVWSHPTACMCTCSCCGGRSLYIALCVVMTAQWRTFASQRMLLSMQKPCLLRHLTVSGRAWMLCPLTPRLCSCKHIGGLLAWPTCRSHQACMHVTRGSPASMVIVS